MSQNPAVPYHLKPKATKLAEGPDDSLDPSVPPTDAERRGIPPIFWAAMDKSKGGTAPPDAPLAPPATDPATRGLPPFAWPRMGMSNRALRETGLWVGDLDPDIAMWPVTTLSRWPFAGHPTEGIWPKGWLGVDSNAVVWVCTVAGEPGTWVQLASGGGGGVYASLTGAGETVSPGALTQLGQLTIQDGPLQALDGFELEGAHNNFGAAVQFETFHGDPNGNITSITAGDLCIDPVSSGIWQSDAGGSSSHWNLLIVAQPGSPIGALAASTGALWLDTSGSGSIWMATGTGVGDWVQVYPSVSTNFHSGHLAVDYDITTGLATFFSTASLGIGTWLVTLAATIINGDPVDAELQAVAGTATATLSGCTATEVSGTNVGQQADGTVFPASLSFIAVVTVAGTIAFQAVSSAGATPTAIKATTPTSGLANATGYTAFQLV